MPQRMEAAASAPADPHTQLVAASDETEPDDAAAAPAPSKIVDGRFVVDPATGPGLVEFAGDLPERGSLWMGPLEGNGGRDVVIFVPPDPQPDGPFELVYHFHGTYSEHIQRREPGLKKRIWVGWNRLQQTIDAATQLQRERPYNVALVYPISAGKRPEPGQTGWFNRAYDRSWMDPVDPPEYRDSFDVLHQEVVEILTGTLGVSQSRIRPKVIAEGHSAGGIALLNIARNKSRHVGEYIFLDASFQGWADGCYEAVQDAGIDALVTLVITDRGMADPFGKRDPWCAELEADARAWPQHAAACRKDPERVVRSRDKTCTELQVSSEEWPDYEAWCQGMKVDMRDTPGVYVHRTKVFHSKQPRHFAGGLELPSDRRKTAG